MRIRFVKIDEVQFLTCLKNEVWGYKTDHFQEWEVGDFLIFLVDNNIAGMGRISGKPYVSTDLVWDNGLFPHRIPVKFTHAFQKCNRLPIQGKIRKSLSHSWRPKFRRGVRTLELIEAGSAETIIETINLNKNELSKIQTWIERYLEMAKRSRDLAIIQIAIQIS